MTQAISPDEGGLPKVCIVMLAYNQERYIPEAVDSILMQQTNFQFDIVISDDHSTDKTYEIAANYAERHPEKIRLVRTDHNIGMMKNLRQAVRVCTSEYIAFLEADDFWTNPQKLQKLADALDFHITWSACFHSVTRRHEDGESEEDVIPHINPAEPLSVCDMIRSNSIATCGLMYRRALLPDLPEWFEHIAIADWPMLILLAERGAIGFVNELMAVMRVHKGSSWSLKSLWYRSLHTVMMLQAVDQHLDYRRHSLIVGSIARLIQSAAVNGERHGKSYREARKFFMQILRLSPSKGGMPFLRRTLLVGLMYVPRFFSVLCSKVFRALCELHPPAHDRFIAALTNLCTKWQKLG